MQLFVNLKFLSLRSGEKWSPSPIRLVRASERDSFCLVSCVRKCIFKNCSVTALLLSSMSRAGMPWAVQAYVILRPARTVHDAKYAVLKSYYLNALQVMVGRSRNAFCCVRPPGHQASPYSARKDSDTGDFCILNNVAIGAAHALR